MKSLALVVPCKNEAKRLAVDSFLRALDDYPFLSFLFVDDGSTDDTAEVLAHLERLSPSIRALYLKENVGKAEAVRAGANWLLAHTDCECVGFWDADLATPLSELDGFVRALDTDPEVEAAIGSRWPHLGAAIDRKVFRHCTGFAMKTLIRLVLGVGAYDTQCGAKVFRRAFAWRVFARPFLSRWLFDVELLLRVPRAWLVTCVVEVPLANWRDVAGSKLGLRDSLRLLPDLLRLWAWDVATKRRARLRSEVRWFSDSLHFS